MSKGKESSPAETAGGEEFSVEKVLDRRVVKGKVCNLKYMCSFLFILI